MRIGVCLHYKWVFISKITQFFFSSLLHASGARFCANNFHQSYLALAAILMKKKKRYLFMDIALKWQMNTNWKYLQQITVRSCILFNFWLYGILFAHVDDLLIWQNIQWSEVSKDKMGCCCPEAQHTIAQNTVSNLIANKRVDII